MKMCGRFTLKTPATELSAFFEGLNFSGIRPRYNICPTQQVTCIRESREQNHEVVPLRWGLVPFLGQGSKNRRTHDQCTFGNCLRETFVPGRLQKTEMPGPGRWFLRMEEAERGKTTSLHFDAIRISVCDGRLVGIVDRQK